MKRWRIGDRAITTTDGELIELIRPEQEHAVTFALAGGSPLWVVRLAEPDPSNPADKIEFPCRECNMEEVRNVQF